MTMRVSVLVRGLGRGLVAIVIANNIANFAEHKSWVWFCVHQVFLVLSSWATTTVPQSPEDAQIQKHTAVIQLCSATSDATFLPCNEKTFEFQIQLN